MEKTTWKIIAIIFITIVVLETSFITWGWFLTEKQIENQNHCFYEICTDYPEAFYEDNLCTCYEYDMFGEYTIAKQILMD